MNSSQSRGSKSQSSKSVMPSILRMTMIVLIIPHTTDRHHKSRPTVVDLNTAEVTGMVTDKLNASVLTATGKMSGWRHNWET